MTQKTQLSIKSCNNRYYFVSLFYSYVNNIMNGIVWQIYFYIIADIVRRCTMRFRKLIQLDQCISHILQFFSQKIPLKTISFPGHLFDASTFSPKYLYRNNGGNNGYDHKNQKELYFIAHTTPLPFFCHLRKMISWSVLNLIISKNKCQSKKSDYLTQQCHICYKSV